MAGQQKAEAAFEQLVASHPEAFEVVCEWEPAMAAKPKVKAVVATVRAPSGQPLARMIAVPKPKPPKGKGK